MKNILAVDVVCFREIDLGFWIFHATERLSVLRICVVLEVIQNESPVCNKAHLLFHFSEKEKQKNHHFQRSFNEKLSFIKLELGVNLHYGDIMVIHKC